ncbi:LysR family transcriptional regulator [Motiliproteus sp. MSK22-1]|uniref:LysR family transcriptional regulator n=1 Tax=Motiliproteus sp. MSK22-1 TaxID=1897630 RepID=UPI000976278E|nr:LysR family transcriptional regulator [Motiliproteus sp. MSK22-1]OMH39692.1 LysR family transcriptional regulator [Motiliproteus sp. MSK22-1]
MLRIYKVVVESGGFAAAEVELNITRSAISMAISDLESRLGFRLCQRGRSGFSLSEEGEHIYSYTLQLLSSIEDFRTQVNTLHTNLKGELNIGITDNLVTMPKMKITDALAALKQQGPDVAVNIRMMPPNEVEIGVLDGHLHVGIVPTVRVLSGLEYQEIYDEESKLYCSDNHPVYLMPDTDIQVGEWDAVLPAYAQTAAIKAHYQPLKAASATATDREGIAFLILTGRYIGYLPDHVAAQWVKAGRMRAISPDDYHYTTQFSAITRKGARPNLVLETYMGHLIRNE